MTNRIPGIGQRQRTEVGLHYSRTEQDRVAKVAREDWERHEERGRERAAAEGRLYALQGGRHGMGQEDELA